MPIVIGGRNGSSKGRVENLVRRSKDRFGGLQIKLGGQSKEERRRVKDFSVMFAGPSYKYMEDLLKIDDCRPHGKSPAWLGSEVTTSLAWEEWNDALGHHPDQRFRYYRGNSERLQTRL